MHVYMAAVASLRAFVLVRVWALGANLILCKQEEACVSWGKQAGGAVSCCCSHTTVAPKRRVKKAATTKRFTFIYLASASE